MWADLPERNPDDARSERDPAAQDSGVRVRASRLEPVPEAGERVEALDFLRGAMAWAVAVYHLGILARAFAGGTPESSSVAALGLHAAPSFFLISGFCFFHLYGARRWGWLELRRFHVQRFLRIAPLFYFAIALHLVFDYQAGPSFSWARLLENVTFTFGLIHPNHAMVVGGWSIGLEYVFYLAFPVLAILLRSLAALSLGAAVLLALAWWHGLHVVQPAPDAARFNAYVLWPNHAYAFLLGGIAAKLRARTARRVPAGAALGVLALVLAVWSQLQPIVIDHFDLVLGITRAWYMLASFAIVTVFALTRTSTRCPARARRPSPARAGVE